MQILSRCAFRLMRTFGLAATARDRQRIMLEPLAREGRGLEIGPSHRPIAPKREGFQVEIMDYAAREALIELYHGMGVDTTRIEHVDHVWSGQRYADLVGGRDLYDWIVASHVLEHVPDLVGTIRQCLEILKPGGVLSIALPNHRYCFDRERSVSSLATVVDAHLRGDTVPSPGTVAEFHLHFVRKGSVDSWDPWHLGKVRRANTPEFAREKLRSRIESSGYEDVHVWVFTPESFVGIIQDLVDLELLDCGLVSPPISRGVEFFVQIRKPG